MRSHRSRCNPDGNRALWPFFERFHRHFDRLFRRLFGKLQLSAPALKNMRVLRSQSVSYFLSGGSKQRRHLASYTPCAPTTTSSSLATRR